MTVIWPVPPVDGIVTSTPSGDSAPAGDRPVRLRRRYAADSAEDAGLRRVLTPRLAPW